MNISLLQVTIAMLAGIAIIIICTTKYRAPAFFALLLACFVTGLSIGLPLPQLINTAKSGFGHTMQSLGFIIVLGTLLGVLLEFTGCTRVMANYILRKSGQQNSSFALALTGFIVGLPVFCDSGFIVLSGLNKSMIRRTGISAVTMSVSLASGLYAVHCLLPPHPGAAAAASTLSVDFGQLILYGLIVAFPAMLVGHSWAKYRASKNPVGKVGVTEEIPEDNHAKPGVLVAFLPVIVPIALISGRSIFAGSANAGDHFLQNLMALGDPVVALAIASLLAISTKKNWNREQINKLLHDSLEKAGPILLIIGAGGAFGAILASTNIGNYFASMSALETIGIFFPFLLTSVLKTAQGSSTVAIITAATIVLPLLPALGLDSENGKLLCALALGAGSMMISHANDAYFWVIARFAEIDMKTMLRVYSVTTIWMGLVSMLVVWVLSLFLL
jgi:GntP family gluconate:H+ symporter